MSTPLATIAFVPREQFSTTRRSLETLYERTPGPFELVCVDGGSPPEVQQYLEQAARERNFTLLRTDHFLTPNQARNLALPHVRTKYVVFVDNDVLVGENFLAPLVECAEQTGAWVVGPLYFELEPEGEHIHMFGGECRIERLADGGHDYVERHRLAHQRIGELRPEFKFERQETELIEFHTVLVAMEAFRRIGPLDEELLCTAEHGDMCLLVRRAGGRVYLEPRSQITYAPPRSLEGADLDFFRLRWSEAWSYATRERLRSKWDLKPDSPGLQLSELWTSGHRRFASPLLKRMRQVLGRKPTRWLEKHVVARFEAAANRRQYPLSVYGRLARPPVRISHAAREFSQMAA